MKKSKIYIILLLALALVCLLSAQRTFASKIDELKNQIVQKESTIQEIEKEIQKFTEELAKTQGQSKTLKNALSELELTHKKLTADLRVTENEIGKKNLTIDSLELEIDEKESDIQMSNSALSESLRRINELEGNSLVESFLTYSSLAQVWQSLDTLEQFQSGVSTRLTELRKLKEQLNAKIVEQENAKNRLISLQSELGSQETLIRDNKAEKSELLTLTKNEEANYKKIIEEKEGLRKEFEAELQSYEAALKKELNPDLVPDAGAIFSWPLQSFKITQLFGGTEFAKRNPQVYGRAFHNGADFAAPVGTKIYAPLSGTVTGAGNTDIFPKCLSYGKWILIDHHNGLTTLYAHLSLIGATPGQQIKTGDVIGFVGNTGYSTGPHLHFTVYQTEGVEVVRLGAVKKQTNCPSAEIPVAPFEAYLDPMQYLPKI